MKRNKFKIFISFYSIVFILLLFVAAAGYFNCGDDNGGEPVDTPTTTITTTSQQLTGEVNVIITSPSEGTEVDDLFIVKGEIISNHELEDAPEYYVESSPEYTYPIGFLEGTKTFGYSSIGGTFSFSMDPALFGNIGDQKICVKAELYGAVGTSCLQLSVSLSPWSEDGYYPNIKSPLILPKLIEAEGKLFSFGGVNQQGDPVNDIQMYDPYTLIYDEDTDSYVHSTQWNALSNMGIYIRDFSVAAIDDDIYIIGGLRDELGEQIAQNRIYKYNITNDEWDDSETETMPTRRYNAQAVIYDEKIYVIGGYVLTSTQSYVVDTIDIYDPQGAEGSRWSTYKDSNSSPVTLRTPRQNFVATVIDDKLYAVGGKSSSGTPLATLEAIDLTNDTVDDNFAVMNTPRHQFAGGAHYSGKIYAIGGLDSNDNDINSIEEYNIANDTWTILPVLFPYILGPNDQKIYLQRGMTGFCESGNQAQFFLLGGTSPVFLLSELRRFVPVPEQTTK